MFRRSELSDFALTLRLPIWLCLLAIGASCSASGRATRRTSATWRAKGLSGTTPATGKLGSKLGGPYNQLWTAGSDAHFEGSGGTVTVSGTIDNLNAITFDVDGYTLNEGTLTFTGSPTWLTASAGRATIGSVVAGFGKLIKYGVGTLN